MSSKKTTAAAAAPGSARHWAACATAPDSASEEAVVAVVLREEEAVLAVVLRQGLEERAPAASTLEGVELPARREVQEDHHLFFVVWRGRCWPHAGRWFTVCGSAWPAASAGAGTYRGLDSRFRNTS